MLRLIGFILIFGTLGFGQQQSKARIEVPQPDYNFNLVQQNTVLEHHFKIQNSGSDTLKILKVKPG